MPAFLKHCFTWKKPHNIKLLSGFIEVMSYLVYMAYGRMNATIAERHGRNIATN